VLYPDKYAFIWTDDALDRLESLKGFINILRVYTVEANREKVEKATAKILGRIPSAAKISY